MQGLTQWQQRQLRATLANGMRWERAALRARHYAVRTMLEVYLRQPQHQPARPEQLRKAQ